jgi:ankyrin repeat protein
VEVVRLTVNKGVDIRIRNANNNNNNNTALHLATESGSVNIINLLLDKGMSVNLSNTSDSTPLHYSAQFGHLKATKRVMLYATLINMVTLQSWWLHISAN